VGGLLRSGVSSFARGMAPAGVGLGGGVHQCSVVVVENRALEAPGSTTLDHLNWVEQRGDIQENRNTIGSWAGWCCRFDGWGWLWAWARRRKLAK
jgi:hypothetical protein